MYNPTLFDFLVTIARAIELKHNPGLVSALSKETSNMYTRACDSLESLDPKIFGHWKVYLGLKSKFYLAYVSFLDHIVFAFINKPLIRLETRQF